MVVAAILVAAVSVVSSWLCGRRAGALMHQPFMPLPDLGHLLLPRAPRHLPDALLGTVVVAMVVRWSQLLDCVPAATAALTTLAIRTVVVHVTLLPSPLPPSTPWWNGTHDLMFSGHTVCFCAASVVLGAPWVAAVGGLSLIAARAHYTIDVAVAILAFCHIFVLSTRAHAATNDNG